MIAQTLFLGENLLPLLTLAFGAALLVGNGAALVKPPPPKSGEQLQKAPVLRTLVFMAVGLVMTVWALATLL